MHHFLNELKTLFNTNDYYCIVIDCGTGIKIYARNEDTEKEIRCVLNKQFVKQLIMRHYALQAVHKIYYSLVNN